MMTPALAELIGTAVLVLLGNGVVANVVLKGTKGEGSGWIVITWGWAMAVFVAVFTVAAFSGAHLNPAVTLGLAIAGKFDWLDVSAYMGAQMGGAMIGAVLVWIVYRAHYHHEKQLISLVTTSFEQDGKAVVWRNLPKRWQNYKRRRVAESRRVSIC